MNWYIARRLAVHHHRLVCPFLPADAPFITWRHHEARAPMLSNSLYSSPSRVASGAIVRIPRRSLFLRPPASRAGRGRYGLPLAVERSAFARGTVLPWSWVSLLFSW